MALPEDFQQLGVRNLLRVVVDLNGFGVVANVLVGGVCLFAAGVAYPRADNSGCTPEPGVGAPESAQGEGGSLEFSRRRFIDGGDWRYFLSSNNAGHSKQSHSEQNSLGKGHFYSFVLLP